jgi:hypothetical protein
MSDNVTDTNNFKNICNRKMLENNYEISFECLLFVLKIKYKFVNLILIWLYLITSSLHS